MKRVVHGKVFLFCGILLLSTFSLATSSWGCDDDKWDRDWHDRWRWDRRCYPCHPPKIERVFLDYNPDPQLFIRFSIWGKNFSKGAPPVVTLGGLYELDVVDYADDFIVATLPKSEETEFDFGDYRLVVSTCYDSNCKYYKNYCSKCKDRYCRDYCLKWMGRYCSSKCYKDDSCRCRDRYALTIARPPGEVAPAGPIELKIASQTFQLGFRESFKQFEYIAECANGFTATGGGFSCPTDEGDYLTECRVLVSEPLSNGTGWRVKVNHLGRGVQLTVHAVCIKVR